MTLARSGSISIPAGDRPGFDHADVYHPAGAGPRIYVAHTGAGRIEVLDCLSKSWLRSLSGHPGVAGVLIDGTADRLFTSDREANTVSVYRCSSETLLARIEVGLRPNGLAYDTERRRLFVFNVGDPPGTGCTVSVLDVYHLKVIKTLTLPGQPRWAVYSAVDGHVYANIREPCEIAVLDADTLEFAVAFHVPAVGPHGLALIDRQLFCAADGKELIVLDCASGKVVGSVRLPGVPDVIWHDPDLCRVYIAAGSPGIVSVVDTETLEVLQTIETAEGAHTTAWDTEAKTLYAFLPGSSEAAVFTER